MPSLRACRVSFTDSVGITHSVEVSAASLYEAATMALAEFRRCDFADAMFGSGTRLRVEVIAPATTHDVSVGKLMAWLEGGSKSPSEQALKMRLRGLVSVQ